VHPLLGYRLNRAIERRVDYEHSRLSAEANVETSRHIADAASHKRLRLRLQNRHRLPGSS